MAKAARPKDPNQLAKFLVEMATGERPNDKKDVIGKKTKKKAAKKKAKK